MKRMLTALTLVILSAPALAAQQLGAADSQIQVAEAVVATDVQDREPVGAAQQFPATVGQVYFYTEFTGDFGEERVEHVWLREGEEMARVPLTVRGPRWRTWSSKQIPADWAGDWTVQVVDAGANVLDSVNFTVGS